jgi:formate hydrogenlyase subunit 4
LAGSTQLSAVSEFMASSDVGLRVSLALALFGLIIVALAENARVPVDNPATHLELTMVHEAMVLEYSGRHLAMIEAAGHLKLTLYISLIICLFLPFGMAPFDGTADAWAIGIGSYLAKLVLAAIALGVWEVSIAKMRVFRVSEFLGGAFTFAFLAILLEFLSREVQR